MLSPSAQVEASESTMLSELGAVQGVQKHQDSSAVTACITVSNMDTL
jgi:hypothetical protein